MKLTSLMVPKINLLFFLLLSTVTFAQSKDGYWDNIRTTNETVTLRAGKKKYIKTADFPTGTTEVVYRITLLDDNQKLSSSLVSLLKAIPDPTGISQGTAGAVFLLSSISGDDKCKYAIFQNTTDADNYLKSSKTDKACFVQNEPVNKEAKLLSSNSKCINDATKNLVFAFQSDNWVMNEKIIIEVVPWVNNKLSRGWSVENKKVVLDICNNLPITAMVAKKDQFCGNFIETISQKYTFKEFTDLLPVEKTKLYDTVSEQVLLKMGDKNAIISNVRATADKLFATNKKQEAINLIQSDIIDKGFATAGDYNVIGRYYLFSKQFDKAQKALTDGINLDPTELSLQLNLAHLYLFTDRESDAKDIHRKYFNQNVSATTSWKQQTKQDFKEFEKAGFSTDDFKRILRIIE